MGSEPMPYKHKLEVNGGFHSPHDLVILAPYLSEMEFSCEVKGFRVQLSKDPDFTTYYRPWWAFGLIKIPFRHKHLPRIRVSAITGPNGVQHEFPIIDGEVEMLIQHAKVTGRLAFEQRFRVRQ